MARLKSFCPECGLPAITKIQTVDDWLNIKLIQLECGHIIKEDLIAALPWELIESRQGFKAYPYQGKGYEFARKSNFRCLIADEPGLGKTIQAILCVMLHVDELSPVLVVVKSALTAQWLKQFLNWGGPEFLPDIIKSSKDVPSAMFNITIVTYDILSRIAGKQKKEIKEIEERIRFQENLMEWDMIPPDRLSELPEYKNVFVEHGFKTVILDECQQIKSEKSKRTNEVREICASIPHVIALSGTPIKNNAGEYFPILNILDSKNFRTKDQFVKDFCQWVSTAYGPKIGGIRDMDYFSRLTQDYIIRRTRSEVLPDLPTLSRKFTDCDFASQKIEDEYKAMQEDFEDFFYANEGKEDFYSNILEKINKLRHKAGVNKVPFCSDFVMDFINDTNRKIVIFTHHIDVAQGLKMRLDSELSKLRVESNSQLKDCLHYEGGMRAAQGSEILRKFENDDSHRILIASTLASGEGLNLQFCSDCIILERQWNPANEEQVEGRFIRIGANCRSCGARQDSGLQDKPICTSCGFELKVDAHYILSTGTIDEYFTELVEYKRGIMGSTLDKKDSSQWSEQGLMKELALILAQKGSKRWRLTN